MSKKQRRRKPRGGVGAEVATPALEQSAREALEGKRWRDAVSAWKDLLKRETRPDWQAGLADAYAGRAAELEAKGMLKEALAIWENRAAVRPDEPMAERHAALLVRLRRPEAFLGLLAQAGSALSAEQAQRMRARLAARVLGGDHGLLDRLAEDDPVRLHADAALAALAAYCNGDDDGLRAAVSRLPFRSPYRDYAQLLKALLRQGEAPAEAQALLARISDDSPFASLKRAAALSLLPDSELLVAASAAAETELRLACVLRGWSPARIALLLDLRQLADPSAPGPMLRLLHRHANALGGDWVRRKSLNLIHLAGDEVLQWLRDVGGRQLSQWERALLAAWYFEDHAQVWQEQERWVHCAELLMRESAGASDPDQGLRIALLLRRVDTHGQVLDDADLIEDDRDLLDDVVADLEVSLRWDPDDRSTYLRLIGWYRGVKDLKNARRVLETGQSHWPEDMALLEAALDIALDAGSFRKAAGLARRILDIDPINSGVRLRLINAHLSHARKQVRKSRVDLARKELTMAADWARDEATRERIALIAALLSLIDQDAEARARLDAWCAQRLDGLHGRLELMLAADFVLIRPSTFARALKLKAPNVTTVDDLQAVLVRLRRAVEHEEPLGAETRKVLDTAMSKARGWDGLTRAQTETACDTLERAELHGTRQRAATLALKRWPREPIFELHRFAAKYPGGYDYSSPEDVRRLDAAGRRASASGDMRLVMRIDELLPMFARIGAASPFPPFPSPAETLMDDEGAAGFDSDDQDGDEAVNAILEMIDAVGIEDVLRTINAPAQTIHNAREMERAFGREVMMEMLRQFLEAGGNLDSLPAPSSPSPPRRSKTKRDGDEDDNPPIQLDLF